MFDTKFIQIILRNVGGDIGQLHTGQLKKIYKDAIDCYDKALELETKRYDISINETKEIHLRIMKKYDRCD